VTTEQAVPTCAGLPPPPGRRGSVERPELLARLGDAADARLKIVTGPAGYGKTTLLASWVSRQPPGQVAWLTMSEAHNDPAALLWDVVAAVHGVRPELDPALAGTGPVAEVVLPRLVNALAALDPVCLVLDDLHLVRREPALGALRWLLMHAPAGFSLVVASRSEPRLRQSTWAARGELVEVRAHDLRFGVQEADRLLNGQHGLSIRDVDVRRLLERTEGWAAGLSLAAMSLQGVSDPKSAISRFDSSDRLVVDYLSQEVLANLDDPSRQFLLDTCILGLLTPALCDHVRAAGDSADQLARLSQLNAFLLPVDGDGATYRYHPLFASVLRAELARRQPGRSRELHERAATWFRDHGLVSQSIGHALDAGSGDEAANLIAQTWPWYADRGRFDTVLGWIDRLSTSSPAAAADPRTRLVRAWMLSLKGDEEAARTATASLEALDGLDVGPLPDGFRCLRSSLLTMKAVHPWGDVGAQLRDCLAAAELEPPHSPMRWLVAWPAGKAHWYTGRPREADLWWRECFEQGTVAGRWTMAISSLAYRAGVAALFGKESEEEELAGQAFELGRRHGVLDLVAEVHVARGRILTRAGRLEEAVDACDAAVRCQVTGWGQPIELSHCLLGAAAAHHAVGDSARARVLVAQARQVLQPCPDPGIMSVRLERAERELAGPGAAPALSPAEHRVLTLLAGELSERAVADELVLSFNTVHSHVRSIYAKLGASSRSEAVALARRLCLLD